MFWNIEQGTEEMTNIRCKLLIGCVLKLIEVTHAFGSYMSNSLFSFPKTVRKRFCRSTLSLWLKICMDVLPAWFSTWQYPCSAIVHASTTAWGRLPTRISNRVPLFLKVFKIWWTQWQPVKMWNWLRIEYAIFYFPNKKQKMRCKNCSPLTIA